MVTESNALHFNNSSTSSLGRPKGSPGRHKGSPWATLGATWPPLGVPRAPLGGILGPPCAGVPLPGAAIGHFERPRRPQSSNLVFFCVILVAICVRRTVFDTFPVHFRCILRVFSVSVERFKTILLLKWVD